MISVMRIDCRIALRSGVTPAERLILMEVVEKWGVRRTGAKPLRMVGSVRAILFTIQMDREIAAASLRQCLPSDLVEDVLIDGRSWDE